MPTTGSAKLALSASGDLLAVGSYREDSAATGINGNGADNSLTNAGAAYLFSRSGPTWVQIAYVKASNTYNGADFGYNVALSGDGSILGVTAEGAASSAGALYAFRGAPWMQTGFYLAKNQRTPIWTMGFGYGAGDLDDRRHRCSRCTVRGKLSGRESTATATTTRRWMPARRTLFNRRARIRAALHQGGLGQNATAGDQFGWRGGDVGLPVACSHQPHRYEDGSKRGIDHAVRSRAATDSGRSLGLL